MSDSDISGTMDKDVAVSGDEDQHRDKQVESSATEEADTAIDDAEKSKVVVADKLLLHYQEIEGDLFLCPSTSSLAHCVSKDLCMSKGIATLFKTNFGRVNELKSQAKTVGECAVLQFPSRYVYYLITKRIYSHKPTYSDLEASLIHMREHCEANGVKELSMPQIGCGLDRLVWSRVSTMIQKVFANVDISITVYIFRKQMPQMGGRNWRTSQMKTKGKN